MLTLHQSPCDDRFVQNPYRLYAQVQASDPIRFWQDYDMPAVFDAATIHTLLRDRRLGRTSPATQQRTVPAHLTAFAAVEAASMLELEPPAHTRLRRLVLHAFTSRRIKALMPDIHDICDRLIVAFPKDPFDLIPAFCTQLPVRIIARLLGVPETMSDDLLRWSHAMVAMYQAGRTRAIEVAANRAALAFTDFLSDYIDARRRTARDDLITHLIAASSEGATLTRQEMIGTCILLLNAGHEATVHTLGNAVKTLLEHNTPHNVLSDERISSTVEELLRYDPPLHMFTRHIYQDVPVGGHMLKAGGQVALILGAAGRDPNTCDQAQRFDPLRPSAPHAAFGGGLHFCVGAPLARLELQIGLQRLFAACPTLTLTAPPRYADTYHFHGLQSLMVDPAPT